MMASWARRNLAALTIFMAAVICLVLLTETIRLRTSLRLAIVRCLRGEVLRQVGGYFFQCAGDLVVQLPALEGGQGFAVRIAQHGEEGLLELAHLHHGHL